VTRDEDVVSLREITEANRSEIEALSVTPQQRRGYGRAALDLIVEYLTSRPGCDRLFSSFVPGDGSPIGFYLQYGFVPTSTKRYADKALQSRFGGRPKPTSERGRRAPLVVTAIGIPWRIGLPERCIRST
jgi:hypothetical protein